LKGRYRFSLNAPGVRLRWRSTNRDGLPILDATLAGERRALTDGAMLSSAGHALDDAQGYRRHPLGSLKIWLRGAKFHTKLPRRSRCELRNQEP